MLLRPGWHMGDYHTGDQLMWIPFEKVSVFMYPVHFGITSDKYNNLGSRGQAHFSPVRAGTSSVSGSFRYDIGVPLCFLDTGKAACFPVFL
jgi:hypothetical protein